MVTQQTRYIKPMLGWCWLIVYYAGPTSTQHCLSLLAFAGNKARAAGNSMRINVLESSSMMLTKFEKNDTEVWHILLTVL